MCMCECVVHYGMFVCVFMVCIYGTICVFMVCVCVCLCYVLLLLLLSAYNVLQCLFCCSIVAVLKDHMTLEDSIKEVGIYYHWVLSLGS